MASPNRLRRRYADMTPAAARLKPTAAAIRRDGVVPGRTDVGEAPGLQVCHPPRHVCDSTRLNSKALPVKVLLETGPSTWFRASAPPGLRSTLGEITGAKGRGGGEKEKKVAQRAGHQRSSRPALVVAWPPRCRLSISTSTRWPDLDRRRDETIARGRGAAVRAANSARG